MYEFKSNMRCVSFLTKKQLAFALAYSAVFPLTNLAGGWVASLGILVTLPFLGLGWIGGMIMVSLVGRESAYLVGVFLMVFFQLVLILFARAAVSRKKDSGAAT